MRYLLACTKDVPEGGSAEPPDHVADARRHIEMLRKKDPKTVRRAERFFSIE